MGVHVITFVNFVAVAQIVLQAKGRGRGYFKHNIIAPRLRTWQAIIQIAMIIMIGSH